MARVYFHPAAGLVAEVGKKYGLRAEALMLNIETLYVEASAYYSF